MTVLRDKIRRRIIEHGPVSIAQFMTMCLTDPEAGYYTTREPFGRMGDFVTAPEVSQMFGELVGTACLSAYEAMGSPERFELVELGPGRGTLMSDILRTAAALRPAFLEAACLNLVEVSRRLRKIQKQTLRNTPLEIRFQDNFHDIPDAPLIVVANEFFDALPIHQFVKVRTRWCERQVGLDDNGQLAFGAGMARLETAGLSAEFDDAPEGTIIETQPAANAIAEEIGSRLARYGGAAFIIDYGYLESAAGDTLQALRKSAFDHVLAHPGEADLTAHVNFETLAASAAKGGAFALPVLTQGEFLLRAGILERAGMLGADKTAQQQETIRDAVERLAAPGQMGDLFKVLALTGDGKSFSPFDRAA